MKAKYDAELSHELLQYIAEITGEQIDTDGSEDNFHQVLKSGAVLCQ